MPDYVVTLTVFASFTHPGYCDAIPRNSYVFPLGSNWYWYILWIASNSKINILVSFKVTLYCSDFLYHRKEWIRCDCNEGMVTRCIVTAPWLVWSERVRRIGPMVGFESIREVLVNLCIQLRLVGESPDGIVHLKLLFLILGSREEKTRILA